MLSHTETSTEVDAQCRRIACTRPTVGRGLCARHYGRWLFEQDPLELPSDTEPAPARDVWRRYN